MKILKIFGIVVGIHVFALILIFANPGCSSTSKPTPAPSDTAAAPSPATVNVPMSPPSPAASGFNPDAPATASTASSGSYGGIRMTPLRPHTPEANAITTAPVTDVTPAQTYTVKSGDSLWELGKKFGVPYAEIAAANNLKSGSPLHAGQKLVIPGKKPATAAALAPAGSAKAGTAAAAKTPAAAPTAAATGGAMKHTVQLGETLSGIAKKYGVTTKELGTANNISDPQKIRPGMELVIPGWNAAGGKAAKSSTAKPSSTLPEPEAPKTGAKPVFSLDPNASTPTPPPTTEPPVIKVEDNPLAPAPKSN